MFTNEILKLENLSKYYVGGSDGVQNVVVGISEVNLSLKMGEFVAITGESGSGKSTLAACLAGILPYEGGEMLFNGQPTSPYDDVDWENYRRQSIAYISQNYGILPGATVLENVVAALRLSNCDKEEAIQKAEAILDEVELGALKNRRAAKLSSGQKQRLSIARALAKSVSIIIADEPTGNLDSQNSQKVVELLAKAAKNHLVIIITHEYDEVKDYATRHIQMQNGHLVLDSEIKKASERKEDVEAETKQKKQKGLSRFITRLQMKSRPVWCVLMALMTCLTAFSTFCFVGTALSEADDSSIRIYDRSSFPNGDELRLAVMNPTGASLTDEDYQTILSSRYIDYIDCYGFATDFNYAYRAGKDFITEYSKINVGSSVDPVYVDEYRIVLTNKDLFVRMVPQYSDSEKQQAFLSAGRLPQKFNEVVAVGDESLLGTKTTIYLLDNKNWSISAFIAMEAEIVGVTKVGEMGFYFHEDVARTLTDSQTYLDIYWPSEANLEKGHARLSEMFYKECLQKISTKSKYSPNGVKMEATVEKHVIKWVTGESNFTIVVQDNSEEKNVSLIVDGYHELTNYYRMIEVSTEDFDELVTDENSIELSAYLKSYAYKDRAIKDLQKKGFAVISPFAVGSTRVDTEKANARTKTLIISLSLGCVFLLLGMISVSALFSAQTDNFKQLSNIGLGFKTAAMSVLMQVGILCLAGELLTLLLVLIINAIPQADIMGGMFSGQAQTISNTWVMVYVYRIQSVTKYLEWKHILLLWSIHMSTTLLGGAMYFKTLRKKVFPFYRRKTDLNWDVLDNEMKEGVTADD